MFSEAKVTEIYCLADDFCKEFAKYQETHKKDSSTKHCHSFLISHNLYSYNMNQNYLLYLTQLHPLNLYPLQEFQSVSIDKKATNILNHTIIIFSFFH